MIKRTPPSPSPREAPTGWVAVRGPSGRLYGYLNPQTQVIEMKRKGEAAEQIALGDLLKH